MRLLFRCLLFVAAAQFCCRRAAAQFYSTGADPVGVHWVRSASGAPWRICIDSAAWRWGACADRVLTRNAPRLSSDFLPLSIRRRRVDVLVHSRHAYSNGLVSWAPRRLEAYSYDVGADDCVPWVTHLMTHEWRHVLQTQSSISGFSRFLYGLLGEQSTGLILGLFVPRWYLEGDAVWAETRYTQGGRGRSSAFLQQMRTLCVAGRAPSFSQAYFGSYATCVPDFYRMGYLMVDEASRAFGNEVFGQAVNSAGRLPFTFFPFQRSLRKQTGMRPMSLYHWALGRAADEWRSQMSLRVPTNFTPLLPSSASYRDVDFMTPWEGGFVSYVSGPDVVSCFEVYDSAMHVLRKITPSERNEERFSVLGSRIVWSERRQNPRWANGSENCLMAADLSTGRVSRVTRGADYHSPALSHDGGRLACVAVGRDMVHRVVVIQDGCEVASLTLPVGWQVPEVVWQDDDRLLLIIVNDDGRQIVSYDLAGGKCELLFGPRHVMLKNMALGNDGRLFFTMDSEPGYFSDIYSVSCSSGELRREVTSLYGVDFAAPHGDSLIVSVYGVDGFAPAKVALGAGVEVETVGAPRPFVLPSDTVVSAAFKRSGVVSAHLRPNLHSWGPVIVDADNQSVTPGVSLASQNVLGTVMMQAGYSFAPDDDVERIFADITWDWLWPRLKFGGRWGYTDYDHAFSYKQIIKSDSGERAYDVTMRTTDRSRLAKLTFEASLPLTHNSGAWRRAVTPSVSFDWERSTGIVYDVSRAEARADHPSLSQYQVRTSDVRYFASTFGLSSHLLRRVAANDVGCRCGVAFSAVYDRAVRRSDYGSMLCLNLRLYMPGIGAHHQLLLSASAQNKWPGERLVSPNGYAYRRMVSDRVAAPYGLGRVSNRRSALLRAAYTLPVCDPDWELGPVAYVKRICFRAVGDLGAARCWTGLSSGGTLWRWTVSGEVWAETRLATLPYPVNIGWRGSYLPDTQGLASALLLSVSFR